MGCAWGTRTPKDRDDVKRREVWECDLEAIGVIYVQVNTPGYRLGKDVSNYWLELWGERGAAEVEGGLRKLNSWSCKKPFRLVGQQQNPFLSVDPKIIFWGCVCASVWGVFCSVCSRRVSILVLGPISSKWNTGKNWNKFELWMENFTPFLIPFCHFFNEMTSRPFERSNNATWREGMWTGESKDVWSRGYRVFLVDRQTKCLGGDCQRTVWCLVQQQLHYLRNRRTEYTLTVSDGRRGKRGYRSNSLSFCVSHATSRVSS